MTHLTEQAVTVTPAPQVKLAPTDQPRHCVGIVGGTFNPVHNGHLVMADQVMQQLKLERVLFIPDANPPHVDHKTAISAKDRAAMVALAIQHHPGFELDTLEIARGGKSYTYDTLVELKRRHPENDYFLILGADMIAYLPKWYRIADLAKLVTFVGVRRPGFPVKSKYPVIWVDAPQLATSSTQLRQLVAQGRSIRYLVPDAVASYIKEKGLYHA
ncbi:nicotinate-nucleotide adenylyltransferase [Lapidilactobacillus luobeiensis]|uniref:nicotinate-nucleotide adenylyltransferase n=1 Tax=Lapidilactobacillus luobeiensis TaxID=2950371 RepID=UPI0021C3F9D4|nr:nicotinate-nucleotide adenylyltransferase [Lapidilactobacillus luobeiensis]